MKKIICFSCIVVLFISCKKEKVGTDSVYHIEPLTGVSGYPVASIKNNLYIVSPKYPTINHFYKYDGITTKDLGNVYPYGKVENLNDKLYFISWFLYECNDTIIKSIPADSDYYYSGSFATYNSKLYLGLNRSGGTSKFLQYDGNSMQNIPIDAYNVINSFMVFNNNLYLICTNTSYQSVAIKFDGTSISPVSGLSSLINPIEYNNCLYSKGINNNANCLSKFDGSLVSQIPNPDNGKGFTGEAAVYNNYLYIRYWNASGDYQLAKYDGIKLTLIPNPNNNHYGVWGSFAVFNNRLFLQYNNGNDKFQLAVYDGTSIQLIDNPEATSQYNGHNVIWKDVLYFQCGTQLAKLVIE